MAKKRLGIGVQTIAFFYNENRIYVDKTEKIYELMQFGIHNFILRPRRFGKSLLLDTLGAIYEGKKEQFVETWIYDKIDWEKEKRPTLRIDFTLIEFHACSLEKGLQDYFESIAEDLGLHFEDTSAHNMFKKIIEYMGKTKAIVILIDEYEMPVTDFVGKNETKLQENIDTLKKLYGVMKGASHAIHRSYITGVTKIGKISILSDLNMLNDLTLHESFTTLLGYTEAELRLYYAEYITEAAQRFHCSEAEILKKIKQHYNGYSWDGIAENKVYNPFSIVNFFQNFKFRDYWFGTGTPTVLVRGARQEQITLNDLDHLEVSGNLLENANLTRFYSISLLFQAGYLTIKKAFQEDIYELGFPNQEVRNAFSSYLLAEYMASDWAKMDTTIAHKLRMCLEKEEISGAFQVFIPVIQSTGYDITKHTEGYFHTIMHVLMYSTNVCVFSELQSLQGRLDTVAITSKTIYIFEFKINSTAEIALQQIKSQGYDQRFRLAEKNLYLIGVNFLTKDKKITEIQVQKWTETGYEDVPVVFEM